MIDSDVRANFRPTHTVFHNTFVEFANTPLKKTTAMGVIKLTVLLLFIQVFPFSSACQLQGSKSLERNERFAFANFVKHENSRLSPTSSDAQGVTTKEDSSLACGLLCTRLSRCFSFNFEIGPDEQGKHVCEALSTDRFNSSQDFHRNTEFHHFSLLVRYFVVKMIFV